MPQTKSNATLGETIKEQILSIRDTGRTNMFDINMVQYLAMEKGLYELVSFIEENKSKYVQFILTGNDQLLES